MNPRHEEVLRGAYLFEELSPGELEQFVGSMNTESYAPNEMIIGEGQTGTDLYLILSGSVRVTKRATDEIEQVIGLLRRGEFFGEMALVDKKPRSASVYAHESTELALFSHDSIYRIFESNPEVAFRVMRKFAEVLSLRLRDTDDKLKTLFLVERTL
ncbi:cyclic nucleotide-binding domain-containing protein [Candidatus Fermentibacterales bacterium]|nr:cyclic nucleotide-binding domain-containing protein [Candidatus Fermentibacterales bacterium]